MSSLLEVTIRSTTHATTITVSGPFDRASVAVFDAAVTGIPRLGPPLVAVDIGAVDVLDSAALGALVRLRRALGVEVPIELRTARDFQRRILTVVGFEQLFRVVTTEPHPPH